MHLDAVEHKDTIVFLHAVEEGPATAATACRSRALAGVPKPVIRQAQKYLQLLEDSSLARGNQDDLFSSKKENPSRPSIRLRDELQKVNPDELTPREALELLYRLKKL